MNLAQHSQRNKPSTKWKSNIIAFKLLRKTQTLCLHTLIKQCKETVWAPGRWGGKCSLLHFGHWPALLRSVSMWLSKKMGKDYSQQAACTEVPSFTGLRLFSLFLKISFFFYFSSSLWNSIKNTNFISQFKCLCLAHNWGLETDILDVLSKWLSNNIWYSGIVINEKTNSYVLSCQHSSIPA